MRLFVHQPDPAQLLEALAHLRQKAARRDGDDYVVNGQKTWTTEAHYADHLFCLVRTDASAKPQRGISFLLIDANAPGVTIRPIVSIDDAHSLNEVFFDDVRVPVRRLGDAGSVLPAGMPDA